MCDADKINKKYIDLVASKNVQVHRQNIVEYLDKAGSTERPRCSVIICSQEI